MSMILKATDIAPLVSGLRLGLCREGTVYTIPVDATPEPMERDAEDAEYGQRLSVAMLYGRVQGTATCLDVPTRRVMRWLLVEWLRDAVEDGMNRFREWKEERILWIMHQLRCDRDFEEVGADE